jgi:hypothetical protein
MLETLAGIAIFALASFGAFILIGLLVGWISNKRWR